MVMLLITRWYIHLEMIYTWKMVIFHSYYVGLVEGQMLPVERPLGFHIVSDFFWMTSMML